MHEVNAYLILKVNRARQEFQPKRSLWFLYGTKKFSCTASDINKENSTTLAL